MEKIYFGKTENFYEKPRKSNKGDAGLDVYVPENTFIEAGDTTVIPSGISVALPENHMLMVTPRSGLSLNTSLRVANSPGIVDTGYRDEIGIIIHNNTPPEELYTGDIEIANLEYDLPAYHKHYQIPQGTRIAQLIPVEYKNCEMVEVDDVKEIGNDRGGGLGSTGVK